MTFDIGTELPFWFISICILVGAVYALALYFKDQKLKSLGIPAWLKYLMAFLRFFVVSLIAFLLLGPFVRSKFRKVEQPYIIILQDNSSSILTGFKNNNQSKQLTYKGDLEQLTNDLSKDYKVKTYSFGEKLNDKIDFKFSDQATNISEAIEELNIKYLNQNIGAIILASDGNYNQGINPIYSSNQLNTHIYTIALGDTTFTKDLILQKVRHNKIVYINNKFSIFLDIQAYYCNNEQTKVSINRINKNEKKLLFQDIVNIKGAYYEKQIPIVLNANKTGIQHYQITLSKIKNETTIINNVKDIFINSCLYFISNTSVRLNFNNIL
ncbi:MAG TPA: hypothetical protein ENH82_02415 [bacterium]|nr:hypothetical protein [bacterium]